MESLMQFPLKHTKSTCIDFSPLNYLLAMASYCIMGRKLICQTILFLEYTVIGCLPVIVVHNIKFINQARDSQRKKNIGTPP